MILLKKLTKNQIIIICAAAAVLITAVIVFFILGQKATVPNVVGMDINEATALLEDAGFTVVTLESTDDVVEENKVIFQDIPAYTNLDSSEVGKIVLTVSKGVLDLTVPDVIKMPLEEAKRTLTDMGFEVTVSEDYHEDYRKGLVISQSIRARTVAQKGSVINIVVSKGIAMVQVPDIKGKSVTEAKKLLLSTGIRLQTEFKESSSVKADVIISQSIKAGETVASSSTLTAVVSIGKANKVGTSPSNAVDFPLVTSQGDWIYFADMNQTYGLYKMRKDGSDLQLLHAGVVGDVNVLGPWIYFTDWNSGTGLYKIKLDGSEFTRVSSEDHQWVYVTSNAIYSSDKMVGGKIYKSDLDGNNRRCISADSCRSINVYGNYIYYINMADNVIYRIDNDGSNKKLIFQDPFGCDCLAVDGGILYFSSHYRIIKLDPKTNQYKIYMDQRNVQKSFLNVCDGWIYYLENDFTSDGYPATYCKIKTDGSSYTKVLKVEDRNPVNQYLNVVNGWIYFPNNNDVSHMYRIKTNGKDLEKVVDK